MLVLEVKCVLYTLYKYYVQGRTKVSLFQNNFALQVIWSVHEIVLFLCKYDVVVMPLVSVETEVKSEFARLFGILILTSHS